MAAVLRMLLRLMLLCLALSSLSLYNPKFDHSLRQAPIVAPFGANSSSSTMRVLLLPRNILELWKEWELRLLVLLSLFIQLILSTQVNQRKYTFRKWIQVMVWTTYILADSIAIFTISVLSNRVTNIKDAKGTIDLKSQITAFWAPFLLLHLGGPDAITAYALEDNELWLRQLARLCIQVGLACYIYSMALSGSTLSILAAGMILVGFIKYAERTMSMYLSSKGQLRDSMLSLPDFSPIYPRIIQQYNLKKAEGYRVKILEVMEAPVDLLVNSGQSTLVEAHELFKSFKLLFLGRIRNFVDLDASKRMFMDMSSEAAFHIVETELGFMYDLLYTKVPLLKGAWGPIRWIINLLVLCAVLVLFSLQDKKDYPKVDICITFLLISVAITLEIYSLLLAISSDSVIHWRLQRPRKSAIAFLRFISSQRWSTSMAQFSLLGLSIRKTNWIFHKYRWLIKLDEKMENFFYINYKSESKFKNWIFDQMKETVKNLEQSVGLKNGWANLKLEAKKVLKLSGCGDLAWSVENMEFDQSILIWHVATELCYYEDRNSMPCEGKTNRKMSKLVSRYMLYLILLHPSMLPTGIGVLRYKDTSVEARELYEGKVWVLSKNEYRVQSLVINWVRNLFKKERHGHTGVPSCYKVHKSRESRDLCEACHLLFEMRSYLPEGRMRGGKRRSVLFDACTLADQLSKINGKWDVISRVWARVLIYAACECKGYEHSASLGRGRELLSHVWLLMAHLGIAEPVQTIEPECATKLIIS